MESALGLMQLKDCNYLRVKCALGNVKANASLKQGVSEMCETVNDTTCWGHFQSTGVLGVSERVKVPQYFITV